MRRYDENLRIEIAAHYAERRSLVATGAKFGVSPTTVGKIIREHGMTPRPGGGRRKPPGSPPRWSRRIASNGYAVWYGWVPGQNRYQVIAEHRLVLERELGRPLARHEEVHHRNGIRDDNRLQNLELRLRPHGSGATHCPHCGQALC